MVNWAISPLRLLSLAALFACLIPSASAAKTTLDVAVGWGGATRMGRWTPVLVTVSDTQTRTATVELSAPHDGSFGMRISQGFTIGPQPATYQLYVPMGYGGAREMVVTLRDADTGKTLARYPARDEMQTNSARDLSAGDRLIGVSGQGATMRLLGNQLSLSAQLIAGYVEQPNLPYVPAGYDSLDLFVLNAPDLSRIDPDQQQAIVDWVRAGGQMLIWPGDDPLPSGGPLVDVLPARVGDLTSTPLDPANLREAGLPDRFVELKRRELMPSPGAKELRLLGVNGPRAYSKRVGLGQIVLAPLDVSMLQFNDQTKARAFWDALVPRLLPPPPSNSSNQNNYGYNHLGLTTGDQRENAALQEMSDAIGNVPGTGSFGFSYVAAVLIGMMVLVGPVDWLVLRKLGRQPWTWVTTGGWIALITLGALYIGHAFKSGDLYYRTIRVVDQSDGATVAASDLIGIYSPRTTRYDLSVAPDGWWEPVAIANDHYARGGMGMTNLAFRQTKYGTTPEPMRINVWNLRFLQGETVGAAAAPPVIEANLSRKVGSDGQPRIVGTVKNLSSQPLLNLHLQLGSPVSGADEAAAEADDATSATENGSPTAYVTPQRERPRRGLYFRLGGNPQVAPGETISVNMPADRGNSVSVPAERNYDYYNHYYYGDSAAPGTGQMWVRAGALAGRRSEAIDQWLARDANLGCVYAESVDPKPEVTLQDQTSIQTHWQVVRALVRLD